MTNAEQPGYDLSTSRGLLDSISAKRALLPVVDHNGYPVSPPEFSDQPPAQPPAPVEPAEPLTVIQSIAAKRAKMPAHDANGYQLPPAA